MPDRLLAGLKRDDPESMVSATEEGGREERTAPWSSAQPVSIGRYKVKRLLGQGGFGIVYLAYDEPLDRSVAIKVPHRERIVAPQDAEKYVAEARLVAALDHPGIVPVYDVGRTEEGSCYVVSKYLEGGDLGTSLRRARPSWAQAAELTAAIAEALHHAHTCGVVHRDVKPNNILLDAAGRPYLCDFGVAIREEEFAEGAEFAGTPAYMSPEQIRGEGHRVDGRSDIFSLGVVFYELLTGRRPFRSQGFSVLRERITAAEPRPPRQIDDGIPKELERICLTALAKRIPERYTTAKDMADDLRHFLRAAPPSAASADPPAALAESPLPEDAPASDGTPSDVPPSSGSAMRVVPKGLRPFDEHDADFFLELLPGVRDRDGWPDSVRFWKTRIEERDADDTFAVGLIYGPSGCGKSSLVRAGLLPYVARHVIPVCVEASATETESRLLNKLRKRCPELPAQLGLKDSLAALRRGRGSADGRKIILVLDQFEQWLHAHGGRQDAELIWALRQCDGGRVQCLLTVRDDFWLAVSRFMRELDVRLIEGHNCRLVDLFDLGHAGKVLAAFGRAFGRLPDSPADATPEQREFVNKAVEGLADDGKVMCVRLALFAEMMKDKAWTPGGLKQVGGTQGVGISFLEETFSASGARAQHRYHQAAARSVLRALLPDGGTNIKGRMRSRGELLAASGYARRGEDFAELLRILDTELRLISPADPAGTDSDDQPNDPDNNAHGTTSASAPSPQGRGQGEGVSVAADEQYFQLTHDYLVPSVREWLARKQKETRRGRAELKLGERTAWWKAKPEKRLLPSGWEWLSIRLLTRPRNWTEPQRQMMQAAGRHHLLRALALAVVVAILGWGAVEGFGTLRAAALVRMLESAETGEVPGIVTELQSYRRWADGRLRELASERPQDSKERLHAGLALLPADPAQVDYLFGQLVSANPDELPVIRDALADRKSELGERLWRLLGVPAEAAADSASPPASQPHVRHRLPVASVLAAYDPASERWAEVSGDVAQSLVSVSPVFLGRWMEHLRPVHGKLFAGLQAVLLDQAEARSESERHLAASILADFERDRCEVLADLVMSAREAQFEILDAALESHGDRAALVLNAELDERPSAGWSRAQKERLARRQASAAVALARLDPTDRIWALLVHRPDARVRSWLIRRFAACGGDPRALAKRLAVEADVSARRGLILALGEFPPDSLPADERSAMIQQHADLYERDPDPGIHAAADRLLRRWGQGERIARIEEALSEQAGRSESEVQGAERPRNGERGWYVNGQGHTMVVIPGPVDFAFGWRDADGESVVQWPRVRIDRTYAIAAKRVTTAQYKGFFQETPELPHTYTKDLMDQPADLTLVSVNWYEAAQYCRWLSEQEGIPEDQMCYPPIPDIHEGMRLPDDYLQRTGYRLPTEAEWEYACRSGTQTMRYYGSAEELLGEYGWYRANSNQEVQAVGLLKPNDFGLFDMLGNVRDWCQESYREDVAGTADRIDNVPDTSPLNNGVRRVIRGGAYWDGPAALTSFSRSAFWPSASGGGVGLRVARTLR